MNTINLIFGLFLALVGGAGGGYILYRYQVIRHKRRILHNIPEKLDNQEKRELMIGGVKVKKNRNYIIKGREVDITGKIIPKKAEQSKEKVQKKVKKTKKIIKKK